MSVSRLVPVRGLLLAFALAVTGLPAAAHAAPSPGIAPDLGHVTNQWLPSVKTASWTWNWSDDTYVKDGVQETYTVTRSDGPGFTLSWNADRGGPSQGEIVYQRTIAGLVNRDWNGTAPPASMPILCASVGQCGNSLASAHFQLIWGTRSPVLLEPLVRGATWTSLGGAGSDVSSENRYVGTSVVKVPAFPAGVRASVVTSEISQAGALGDPYGSGIRTVWWVYGVGPVQVRFEHTGGAVTTAALGKTDRTPLPPPDDTNWFPLEQGASAVFEWRNSKWLRTPSRQRFNVERVVNGTARVDVKDVRGPVRVAGSYVFTSRLNGVTATQAAVSSKSLARFPGLGPRSQPAGRRRHLLTPYDFMVFGFNPVLPAYPRTGQTWSAVKRSRDYRVFGVTGTSKVLGVQRVRTPAGTFRALAVRSKLRQAGFRYGSGTRTSWFAPGRGLVKLEFRHADGSRSTVVRVK